MIKEKKIKENEKMLAKESAARKTPDEKKRSRGFKETHGIILEKAMELFSQKGFKGSTTREIASCAGVTEVTLYRHFSSKEEVFCEIVKNFSLLPFISDNIEKASKLPLRERLEFISGSFIKLFRERAGVLRLMLAEAITHQETAKLFFNTVPAKGIEMISKMFETEINAGRIKKIKPRLLARSLLGMFLAYNLMQEILYGKETEYYQDDEVIKNFIDIFLNGAQIKR